MSTFTLKLADLHIEPDILPMERRNCPRRRLHVDATMISRTGDALGRISSVKLFDASDTGLGAVADKPVDLNAQITICFQAHGPEGGFDATGRVVRSQQTARGNEIGILLDQRCAA